MSDTSKYVNAMRKLINTDFNDYVGAGLRVSLRFTGKDDMLVDDVEIRAEDFESVKTGIIESIRDILTTRKIMLLSEISDVESVIFLER